MIQIQSSDDDPDRVMIQIQSSDDDPDLVMMIQQKWSKSSDDAQWWSRSSNDPDPVMMIQIQWWCPMMIQIERWSRFEDEDDLKIKMIWRWRWLEYLEYLRCRWRDDPADTEKKTSVENYVERIPS